METIPNYDRDYCGIGNPDHPSNQEPIDAAECDECGYTDFEHGMFNVIGLYWHDLVLCHGCMDGYLNNPDNEPDEWIRVNSNTYRMKHSPLMRQLQAILDPNK